MDSVPASVNGTECPALLENDEDHKRGDKATEGERQTKEAEDEGENDSVRDAGPQGHVDHDDPAVNVVGTAIEETGTDITTTAAAAAAAAVSGPDSPDGDNAVDAINAEEGKGVVPDSDVVSEEQRKSHIDRLALMVVGKMLISASMMYGRRESHTHT